MPQGVDSLTNAAQRHLASMSRGPGTPYQRLMTLTEKEALRADVEKLADLMQWEGKEAARKEAMVEEGATPLIRRSQSNLERPSTSMSFQDFSMPCPGPRLSRMQGFPGGKKNPLSVSWSGPMSDLKASRGGGPCSTRQAPIITNFTPRMGMATPSLRHPLRASDPLPPLSSDDTTSPHGTKMTNASFSGSTRGPLTPGIIEPSRGLVYSVFNELDGNMIGKVTWTAFEDASVKIGLKPEQALKFFKKLDGGKGYISMDDWRVKDNGNDVLIENFTRLYVTKTRCKEWLDRMQRPVPTLHMAIQMAITKLKLKARGRTIPTSRLLEAFHYMDYDSSGVLSKDEVQEAFQGMGINITADVADEVMRFFDKDQNGVIDLREFGSSLYPGVSLS